MRLRTKYALVLLAVMLVLGGVVLGSTELFKQQTLEEERANLAETTNLTAAQLEENLENLENRVATFAARDEFSDFRNSSDRLGNLVNNTVFNQASIAAANGTIIDLRGEVDRQDRERLLGVDVSNQTFFQVAMDADEYIHPPSLAANSSGLYDNSYEISVSAPIFYADDQNFSRKGVLTATARIPVTGILDPLTVVSGKETIAHLYATTNESERVDVFFGAENRSFEDPLNGTVTLDPTGWELVLSRDRAALTERLQTLQFIQGGSLLAVLVSIVGLGVWQYRTNLRQTDRLLEGFDALTRGQFGYRLRMRAAEEWRQIGAGFNNLAQGLREREQAIQEREQRLSVLNRVLRHNLQNDLTVVQGYAEMLTEFDDEEEIADAQAEIMAKVEGLIEHGQKARRIETALESAEEGSVDIDVVDVVEDLLDDYAAEYPEVAVSRDLPAYAYVSAITSLKFGVESIVENAFEHNTSDDPTVHVDVDHLGDTVEVRVGDNGPGIPEHEYQVLDQEEETALEHGSGIGMWLAYWVVEKSHGELRFDQAGEGVTVTMAFHAGETPEDAGEDDDLLDF